mmetsp:Transcript_94538/g.304100  ORF Transcript_94538/g.304100 Transcript_94538/m.304100 type:complete len:245 (-) Transcript_94538:237-971(-)
MRGLNWPESHQAALCQLPVTNARKQLYLVLCLWWMSIVAEVRKNERMLRHISQFPTASDPRDMIHFDPKTHKERIMRLSPFTKCLLYSCIAGMKLLISIGLLLAGTVWLTASQSIADLLLNSVALGFIILVDETIYNALYREAIQEPIHGMKLWLKSDKGDRAQKDVLMRELRESWMYYSGCLILVALYLNLGQSLPYIGVLPNFQYDALCPLYWETEMTRVCGAWPNKDCFPYGSPDAPAVDR